MRVDRAAQEPAKGRLKTLIITAIVLDAAVLALLAVFPPYLMALHDSTAISVGASLNATTVTQNQTVRVDLWDTNGLPVANELPLTANWGAPNMTDNPCGGTYPLGIAVFQGRYALDNISSARAIAIYDIYSGYFCGAMTIANSFTFGPLQGVSRYVDLGGYWTAGETAHPGGGVSEGVLHPFVPGVYTLVAGDGWGHIKILYFQVVSAAGSPVEVVSVTGPIPPYNPGGPVISITLKNVGDSPITSLSATLRLPSSNPNPYGFNFDVSQSNPLAQNMSSSFTRGLIGAGFQGDVSYPLAITGTLANGAGFSYTVQVQVEPPVNSITSTSTTTVNGSAYYADNMTSDITVGNPGYSYFLNGSVTFMGVKFATICPPIYAGCPIPPGTTVTTQETVGAGAIRLNLTFPDGSNETIGGVIGDITYFFVFSHHANPQAGILIVYTSSGYKSYLLVSSFTT